MRTILSIVVVVTLAACDQQSTWTSFEQYPDSEQAITFELENGVAFQRNYIVNEKYPNSQVVEHYEKVIDKPWTSCLPRNTWSKHLDATGEEIIYVHQILRHWANYSTNRLLLLAVRYESIGNDSLKEPNNDRQSVILVEYIEPELESSLDILGLSCVNEALEAE